MKFQNLRVVVLFLKNLKNSRSNNSKNKNEENFGFSLIELSIVLIIIGLLVAGVTGGASLIESARIRAVANEVLNYKQALNAFYAARGRLPGDLVGSGKIGYKSDQTYDENSFPAPYNSNDGGYGIPTLFTAPFVDLYLEKIIDFEPKNTNIESEGKYIDQLNLANNGALPKSNTFKGFVYSYRYDEGSDKQDYYRYNNRETISVGIFADENDNGVLKIIKNLDKKIDDGIYNSGNMRGYCSTAEDIFGYVDYENAKRCKEATFFADV